MEKKLEEYKKVLHGFSKLNRLERLLALKELSVISTKELQTLTSKERLGLEFAENFIENVIGYFEMPMGVATNFVIDNKPYVIPMAVEETSIIAAACKTAKWIAENGSITTSVAGNEAIGQVQILNVKDFKALKEVVDENSQLWVKKLNKEVASGLVGRGGGVTRLHLRQWTSEDKTTAVVIHIYINTCDAMGANVVNQVCEYLKVLVQEKSTEKVGICIVSNLVDSKLTKAQVKLNVEESLGVRIQQASQFAWEDPYRAATNNKGVLNGIDPILIATGNDWRAVEAGAHAYAARTGQYRSLTRWTYKDGQLVGEFEAPVILGIVGGVTTLHPTAQASLKMMNIQSAEELSRVCAAVGLVQNLGALKALTTEGIIEGHMKLHIKNLSVGAGATQEELPVMQKKLEGILYVNKRVSLSNAIEVLQVLRKSDFAKETSSGH